MLPSTQRFPGDLKLRGFIDGFINIYSMMHRITHRESNNDPGRTVGKKERSNL